MMSMERFIYCPEGKIPSFVPINYDRKKIEIVEQKQEKPVNNANIPEPKTPEIPDIPKEKRSYKDRTLAQVTKINELETFVTKKD